MLLLLACAPPPAEVPAATLSVVSAPTLTPLAEQAVALSPAWLRHDLALSFRQLDDTTAETLAQVLVDLDEPWLLDEVAFSVAHLSPEVLAWDSFYPQILVENAQLVYARDADLAYVELVETGEAGVDDDYFTTAAYRVGSEDGTVTTVTIDRDYYYWHLVHPRMEDEVPVYVDPEGECLDYGTQCPVSPEEGDFWRAYLWESAGLSTAIAADTLWNGKAYSSDDNGAVGEIIEWLKGEMVFGAYGERSIQPVRIHVLGRGNCGEWSDMTTAAARTALIPTNNVGAFVNDHTWNEFWIGEWVQWEPVNTYVEHYYYYQSTEHVTNSLGVFAVQQPRGDASMGNRTAAYGNTFDLDVKVRDRNGNPVDGAAVTVWGPLLVYGYEDEFYPAIEATTDVTGRVVVPLGEINPYKLRVESAAGNSGTESKLEDLGEGFLAGEVVPVAVATNKRMPTPPAITAVEASGPRVVDYSVTIDGFRTLALSSLRGTTFAQPTATGALDTFVVDEAGYAAFLAGQAFDAVAPEVIGEPGTLQAVAAVPVEETWYVVVGNVAVAATASLGSVEVRSGEASTGLDFRLLPGEHVAIAIE